MAKAKAPEVQEEAKNPYEERIVWNRPSGEQIMTNSCPATIKKAEELGWEKAE